MYLRQTATFFGLMLSLLGLTGCIQQAKAPGFPLKTSFLTKEVWQGENATINFEKDASVKINYFEWENTGLAPCDKEGSYEAEGTQVQIEWLKCDGIPLESPEFEAFSFGEDDLNIFFTSYLESQNSGEKFYSVGTAYEEGTEKVVFFDDQQFKISTTEEDPKLKETVTLYEVPALSSDYFSFLDEDGNNHLFGANLVDGRRYVIGSLVNEEGEWYLIKIPHLITGSIKKKTYNGAFTGGEKTPAYAWVHQSDIL